MSSVADIHLAGKETSVKNQLAKSLLIASLSAFSVVAAAQNDTPRDNPASASTTNTTQNGTQTGTTSSTGSSAMGGGSMKYRSLSDADIRSYKSGWAACDRMTGDNQITCRTKFASTWSQVDPKCQKVSGAALDDCLKGADHGQ